LFAGGLPYSLSVDELREAFTPYGNILRVAIPKDPETGESRGFGYVEFDSQDSAHSAMEALSGQELGGRTMRLDYALPRGHSNGDGG
ncbi:RNA-binding region RNP-1, partial [Microstroma glucosiphilum]